MPVHAWEVHDDMVWAAAGPALVGRAPPKCHLGPGTNRKKESWGLGAMAMWTAQFPLQGRAIT